MRRANLNELERKVNWESAKLCLAELQIKAPTILQQGVIIGGIACWFYRNLLQKAHDPVFKAPAFSATQEKLWLSKDIDFTNFFAQDARELLAQHVVMDAKGRAYLQIAGIPIGFAQVGLTFDPETAWAESWIATFSSSGRTVQCRIIDPVSLYREKLHLSQRRGVESDKMHCALMAEYLRFELCNQIRSLVTAKSIDERTQPIKYLISIRDRAIEITQDIRVMKRVRALLDKAADMAPSERKLVADVTNFSSPPSDIE